MSDPHIITDPTDAAAYMRSGNAKVTIRSLKTGTRYTYKITAPYKNGKRQFDEAVRFVKLLTGSDEWAYIGAWYDGSPWLAAGAKGNAAHPAFKALNWVIGKTVQCANNSAPLPEEVEVWHEGTCGRCGRSLTDPASIERGIGPECATKV